MNIPPNLLFLMSFTAEHDVIPLWSVWVTCSRDTLLPTYSLFTGGEGAGQSSKENARMMCKHCLAIANRPVLATLFQLPIQGAEGHLP